MVIKKICYVGLIFFLLVSLTSCKKEIPDGEIKDFVLNFDYDKTLVSDKYKDIQINEYISCLNKEFTREELSQELQSSIEYFVKKYNPL